MKTRILCIGDSNTNGYDPRGFFGDRFPAEVRWTGRLARSRPWEIMTFALNGRTIPHSESEFRIMDSMLSKSQPVSGLVIMLGTNDATTMFRPTPQKIVLRMERFLLRIRKHPCFAENPPWILLLAPPILDLSWWEEKTAAQTAALCRGFNQGFNLLAAHLGIYFADTALWNIPLVFDGTHFSAEGHEIFAQQLAKVLDDILSESSEPNPSPLPIPDTSADTSADG